MKKVLFFLILSILSITPNVFAEPITDIRPLLQQANKKAFEEENHQGYPVTLLWKMSDQEKKEFNKLVEQYTSNLTEEQKQYEALINRIKEKCPTNTDTIEASDSILSPNAMFQTSDRVVMTLFEKGNPKISQERYDKAVARQKLAKIVTDNQEEIYAYATLFCPRHAHKLRGELNMSPDFSYKNFYNTLSKEEKEELNRVVYISVKHLKRYVNLGLPTNLIGFMLSDVPQLMYREFKKENPLAAQIDTHCQDDCRVHEIYLERKEKGARETPGKAWEEYVKEYALANMKTGEKKCHKKCFCNSQKGILYGHKEAFIEIAEDVEKLKGKTVIFSPNGERDEIDITDGIAYSISNGRIVVFPQENDEDSSLTAAIFFAEQTAANVAKECQKDQFFGVLPDENGVRNMLQKGQCYPRDLAKARGL